jgi:hypothetical protein
MPPRLPQALRKSTGRRRRVRPPQGPQFPAQILDLTNWKITLPVDNVGTFSGTAVEVKQPQLATFSDAYFFVGGGGVVFHTPVEGARTSGSNYPRSELREMTGGGATQASWSSTSGTHTLTVSGHSTHLPPGKPQNVLCQIHDASNDIIEVLSDATRGSPTAIAYRFNGSTQPTHLDDAYVLGTAYTIQLVAAGGVISLYYNGVLKDSKTFSGSGLYFKAGSYTQSNTATDSAGEYGEAVITALSVVHG